MTARRMLTIIAVVVLGSMAAAQSPAQGQAILKVAFSASVFGGINPNDAQAAMSVWARTIAEARGVNVVTETEVVEDLGARGRAMDAGAANLVILSVNQFRQLARPRFGTILLGTRAGRTTDSFLLLVKKDRFVSLCDLKERSLVVLEGTGHDLSLAWPDWALRQQKCGQLDGFFARATPGAKPARVALPVFFGQADAGLMTQYNYQLMAELNPQLGGTLVPLATSEPLVHAIVLLDHEFAPEHRQGVLESLLALNQTPRGRQVLSLFGLDGMAPGTPAHLAPSLALLDRLDRGVATRRVR